MCVYVHACVCVVLHNWEGTINFSGHLYGEKLHFYGVTVRLRFHRLYECVLCTCMFCDYTYTYKCVIVTFKLKVNYFSSVWNHTDMTVPYSAMPY